MLVVLLILAVLVMAALFYDNKDDSYNSNNVPKVWYKIYNENSGIFICYNALILLVGNVVMILFMKYNDCLKNDLI
jgi:hypothetical protein